jgi:hypothetical protein
MNIVPLAEVKARFSAYFKKTQDGPIIVTKKRQARCRFAGHHGSRRFGAYLAGKFYPVPIYVGRRRAAHTGDRRDQSRGFVEAGRGGRREVRRGGFMPEQKLEISISQIPESLYKRTSDVVNSFSTGLIQIAHRNQGQVNATLMGSGTFVSIQGSYGILTAHHVTELLENGDSLGLILIPNAHRIIIDFQYFQVIKIVRGSVESEGPDLSFISLPVSKASEIKPYKTFYNLSADREMMLKDPPDVRDGIWYICGIPNERTSDAGPELGFEEVISFEGICGATGVDREYSYGGYDYIEVGVEYAQGLDVPHTFGGVSGGGLWQVPFRKLPDGTFEPVNYYLSGVIFYQSDLIDGKRFIRCHGRKSIYFNAYEKIINAFPR